MIIKVNLDNFHNELVAKINGHVGSMRTVLRSIEDGTYGRKAAASAPGSLLNWQLPDLEARTAEYAREEIARTVLRTVGAYIDFLDTMVAVLRVAGGGIRVERDLHGDEEIQRYAQEAFDRVVQDVARDMSLSNPKKLAQFPGISDFSKQASLSYFELRRCLEHHKGMATESIPLVYTQLRLSVDGKNVEELPYDVQKGQVLAIAKTPVERIFKAGEKVLLTETEAESIAFTISLFIGPEILAYVRRITGTK